MSNKKLIGNFVLDLGNQLGQGQFGKVYQSYKINTPQQKYAVKVLDRRQNCFLLVDADQYTRQAIKTQIKIMSKIQSQYCLKLVTCLQSKNNYYLIQQKCQTDFRKIMKKNGKFTQKETIDKLSQIVIGFIQLVDKGIIHRDLKPENILIKNNKLKIADFGLSKIVDSKKQTMIFQSAVGTPIYAPLQMLKGQKYSSKFDIWSLGCITYEMLFTRIPWNMSSMNHLIKSIQQNNIQYPYQISNDMKSFIEGCLKVNQKDRFSWDQLIKHPIFKGVLLLKQSQSKVNIEQKSKFIIKKLRQIIHSKNIDLLEFFSQRNFKANSILNYNEFISILLELNNQLTNEELNYLCQMFDDNKDGKIQFKKVKNWFQTNDVRMSGIQPRQLYNDIFKTKDQQQNQICMSKRALEAVQLLSQRITKKGINVIKLFNMVDKSNSQQININQFELLLHFIDSSLNSNDIKEAFKFFDIDHNGKISKYEFQTTLAKIAKKIIPKDENQIYQRNVQKKTSTKMYNPYNP